MVEETLWQAILNYGGLAVLTVLFFLFAKGMIVSKATLEQTMASHKATIERIVSENTASRVAYQETIESLADGNKQNLKLLCDSYQQTVGELKSIIAASKNGGAKKAGE